MLRALKYDPLYEELVAIFQRANPVFTLSYKNNWSFAFLAPDLLACIEAVEVVLYVPLSLSIPHRTPPHILYAKPTADANSGADANADESTSTDYLYDPHCHPIFRNLTIDQHPLPSFLHPILTALPHLTHIRLTPSAGTNGANFIHFWLKNLVGLRTLKRVNVVMPQLQQDMGEVDDGMGWKGRSWVLEEDMREIAERHMKVKADGLLGADGRLEVGGEGEMARRIWVWEVEEGMVLRELSLEVMEMTYNP